MLLLPLQRAGTWRRPGPCPMLRAVTPICLQTWVNLSASGVCAGSCPSLSRGSGVQPEHEGRDVPVPHRALFARGADGAFNTLPHRTTAWTSQQTVFTGAGVLQRAEVPRGQWAATCLRGPWHHQGHTGEGPELPQPGPAPIREAREGPERQPLVSGAGSAVGGPGHPLTQMGRGIPDPALVLGVGRALPRLLGT